MGNVTIDTDGLKKYILSEYDYKSTAHYIISNIIDYADLKQFDYEKTLDLLMYLLDGVGIDRNDIAIYLTKENNNV